MSNVFPTSHIFDTDKKEKKKEKKNALASSIINSHNLSIHAAT